MPAQLARNWWTLVIRGVLAILFGILTFLWPAISLTVLVLFFGAYVLVDGIFALVSVLTNRAGSQWGWVLFEGIAGIIVGILTFIWPGITALVLLYLIAAWAIVTGIFEILAAIELRKEITNEWFYIIGGILSVAFGVIIVLFPGAGALGIILWIAAYAIVFGILLVVLGLRLRSWNETMQAGTREAGRAA
jgi:uncharacterized membrane protein HdeD (DUF308 family)